MNERVILKIHKSDEHRLLENAEKYGAFGKSNVRVLSKGNFSYTIFGSMSAYEYRIIGGPFDAVKTFLTRIGITFDFRVIPVSKIKEMFQIEYIGKGIKHSEC